MNVNGVPKPWMAPAQTTVDSDVSTLKPPMMASEIAARAMPISIVGRGPIVVERRAPTIIATIADNPREATSQPACVGV